MSCLFVEHLTVIDCAYLDVGRGLLGQSWIVDLELDGALDEQSMVLDFGAVKKRLKRAIDDSVDHSLLVPGLAPQLSWTQDGDTVDLRFDSAVGAYHHRSPALAVCRLDAAAVDAGAVARYLIPRLRRELPSNVGALRLQLREEIIDGAHYQYVHGLKKHQGACQRIAHGHRSRVEVRVEGARDPALEAAVASAWTDIYLGTRDDLVAQSQAHCQFAYTSQEGRYELSVPRARCDLIETDSTVECIAAHLLARLQSQRPGRSIEVRAYEGVMKGAISRSV